MTLLGASKLADRLDATNDKVTGHRVDERRKLNRKHVAMERLWSLKMGFCARQDTRVRMLCARIHEIEQSRVALTVALTALKRLKELSRLIATELWQETLSTAALCLVAPVVEQMDAQFVRQGKH